jgi:hypothetical protein
VPGLRGAVKLTAKQAECLADAAAGPINSFDYGSTTIARLRSESLIESYLDQLGLRRYRITEYGRVVLRGTR